LSYKNTVILGFLWGLPLLRFGRIGGIVGGIMPILPSPLLWYLGLSLGPLELALISPA